MGILVLGALAVLATGVLLIGEQKQLFSDKTTYFIKVRSVSGLNEGNPVQLNGVSVGTVTQILLPRDVSEEFLTIYLEVQERYEERIRADSVARIRTLGLLGDKYVEITSGSPVAPVIPPGGQIPTAGATDVDRLIASGEDVVDNMVAISHSLRSVLDRVDRGEGLIGELTTEEEAGKRITDSIHATLDSIQQLAAKVESGDGALARLVNDEAMGERLAGSVARLEGVLAQAEEGDGLLPRLLRDEAMGDEAAATLAELRRTAVSLRQFTTEIEQSQGLFDRLVTDEAFAQEISDQLRRLVGNLGDVAEKLNRGDGTAAKLINDPNVYDAVNDIIVGIDESALLRWLVRNRQKKGIEVRYDEASGGAPPPPDEAGPDEPGPAPEGDPSPSPPDEAPESTEASPP